MRFVFLLLLPILIYGKAPIAYSFSSKDKPLIVIDAGHGGISTGAKAHHPFCEEKRIALATAFLTQKYLDQLGYRTLLTRKSDIFLPLSKRILIANRSPCLLFISIHFNSAKNPEASGMEVFYFEKEKGKKRSISSKKLAGLILTDLVKRTQAKSRGIKNGNLFVLREVKVPAVLVEGGFITNFQERNLLKQRDYLDKIARGIATGIDQYLKPKNVLGAS